MKRPWARCCRIRFCVLRKPPTCTILSKDVPYALRGSFIGILGGLFGLVFADRPGHGGGFVFQSTAELCTSIGPRVRRTLSSLNILQSRLRLLHDQGFRQFDQIFGQTLALLLGDQGRLVPR